MFKTLLFVTALGLCHAATTRQHSAGVPVAPAFPGLHQDDLDSCEWFENGCPSDFDRYVVFPHETSCRNFWQCVNGERALRRCARGTVFNAAVGVCDHPANVDRTCENEDSSEEIVVPDDSRETDFDRLPNGCPVDGNIEWLLPHSVYCNMYYQCLWGLQIEQFCGVGTHFSVEAQACVHIEQAGCTGPDAAWRPPTGDGTTPNYPTPPTDVFDNGCPTDVSIEWNVPHEDCSQYYACVWGQTIAMPCPAGLHFSFVLQRCDNPAVAGCKVCGSGCTSSEEEPPMGGDDPSPPTAAPTTTTTTAAPTTTTTTTTTPVPTTTTTTTTTPAPTTTTTTTTTTTPAPTTTTAAPTTTTAAPTTTTAAPTTTTAAPTTTTAPPTTIDPDCEEDDSNRICIEQCNVFPWAHADCDKFWTCDGQQAVLVVCTEGLFFNPSTGTCDFPCNTDCVRQSVQATASHSGLKVYLPWHKIDEDTKSLLKLISN